MNTSRFLLGILILGSSANLALGQSAGPTPGPSQHPAPITAPGAARGIQPVGGVTGAGTATRPKEERTGPPGRGSASESDAHPATAGARVRAPGAVAGATAAALPTPWEHIDGCARDISIARPGVVFVVGCEPASNANSAGHPIYRWENGEWWKDGIYGIRVFAIAPHLDGNTTDFRYMVLNSQDSLSFSARPLDMPSGPQRTLDAATGYVLTWVIGAPQTRGYDGQLYRAVGIIQDHGDGLDGSVNSGGHHAEPCKENITGVRVAASSSPSAWVLKRDGAILEIEPPPFKDLKDHCGTPYGRPGCAKAIAVGTDDRPWVLGCEARADGNYPVFHANAGKTGFEPVSGWGVDIAVDPANNLPWVVTRDGEIYRLKDR